MSANQRTALVTGANKGIGKAITAQLLAEGFTVFMGARDAGRGKAAAAELSPGGDARFVQLDVTNEESIAAAAAAISDVTDHLDVLVNNAGIAMEAPVGGPSKLSVEVLRNTYETNVFGVVAVTNAFLPLLERSEGGRVVNLSSETGSKGIWSDPTTPMSMFAPLVPGYSSSKAALNAITVAYAREHRDTPLKFNAVSPGHIGTDLNHNMGPGTPEQGAAVVVPYALLDADGPSGGFFGEAGPVPW